jgi:hypothetical protein
MIMMKLRCVTGLMMAPLVAIALANVGCGEKKSETPRGGGGGGGSSGSKGSGAGASSSSASSSGEKTELKASGSATIKGKVTYNGTPPKAPDIDIPDNNKDKSFCLKGTHTDQTWVVGPDKGVANVVVWIRPPKDKFFVVPPDQQKPEQAVAKVDQPFCAFEPHVSTIFPSFYDPATKQQKPTGQIFEVGNAAPISHNTNWNPTNPLINASGNQIIKSHDDLKIALHAAPQKKADGEDLIQLKCNIHTWMRGYVWAFTHPWSAVTKPDGTYEIKNVPAGSELFLVAWHEPMEYLLPEGNGSREGTQIGPLKDGETKVKDFTVGK